MNIWNSKHALTKGLIFEEAELVGYSMVRLASGYYLHGEGKEWHRTRARAVARAETMRARKIESLKKQIKRLEEIKFDF
jgi:hypothetical protein